MAEWGFNVHVSAASPVLTYAVLRPVPPPAPPDTVPAVMPLPVPLMWDARLAFARLWQLYRRLIQVLTLPDSFRWRSEPMPPIVKELATDCRIEIGIRRPVGTVANDRNAAAAVSYSGDVVLARGEGRRRFAGTDNVRLGRDRRT